MELFEMIGWVVLGFVPMLGALHVVSRKVATIKHTGEMSVFSRGEKLI
jgi:uncharacterized membrane protein YesL